MKNYFLLRRDLKQEILAFVSYDEGGVGENEIVKHILAKFGLYDSGNPYKTIEWGNKIRAHARNLAEQGKIQKYVLTVDNDVLNWYVDHDAPVPDWLFELEEGKDWTA